MMYLLRKDVNDTEKSKLDDVGDVLEFCRTISEYMDYVILNNDFDVTRQKFNYSVKSLRNSSDRISMFSSLHTYLFDLIVQVYLNPENNGEKAARLIYLTINNLLVFANEERWVDHFFFMLLFFFF